jgi:hypothetical protein
MKSEQAQRNIRPTKARKWPALASRDTTSPPTHQAPQRLHPSSRQNPSSRPAPSSPPRWRRAPVTFPPPVSLANLY